MPAKKPVKPAAKPAKPAARPAPKKPFDSLAAEDRRDRAMRKQAIGEVGRAFDRMMPPDRGALATSHERERELMRRSDMAYQRRQGPWPSQQEEDYATAAARERKTREATVAARAKAPKKGKK